MNSVKLAAYSILITGLIILTAYTTQQNRAKEIKVIPIDKYNSIYQSIDSLEIEISRKQKENERAQGEIRRINEDIKKLNADCEALKKSPKSDSAFATFDSVSSIKIRQNCDSLAARIKALDSKKANKENSKAQATKILQTQEAKLAELKGKLQDELKVVSNSAKQITGSLTLKFRGVDYNIFIANSDSNEIKMHLNDKSGKNFISIGNLRNFLTGQKEDPVMITNAGMYMPNLQPQGLFVAYQELHPIDLRSPKTDANFYLMPNGVFYIDTNGVSHIDTTQSFQKKYESKSLVVDYATQSGPMLVINGNIHRGFAEGSNNRKIRSGVGVIDSKKTVFAISLDETNFYDFAVLFKDIFGCRDALYLDGAISQMYLQDLAPDVLDGQFGPMISVTKKKNRANK